jgi:hypothetical protein
MSNQHHNTGEPTAVDDVRRVRERIAREYGGDLAKHAEQTNRIAAEIRAKLKIRVVPPSTPAARRTSIGE